MSKKTKYNIALALDNVSEQKQLEQLVNSVAEYVGVYKIGLEQYIRFGPEILETVRKDGNKIFLDLKLHDIPNTVGKAVLAASKHAVNYLTVHTSGGSEMLKAATQAAQSAENPPKIVGVTVLTSIDQHVLNKDLQVTGSLTDHVRHLTQIAVEAELDGIVCSASDLPYITQQLPESFEVITPGIRLADTDAGDQKRVATPQQAIENGATMLVIGRPISAAANPVKAANGILESITK